MPGVAVAGTVPAGQDAPPSAAKAPPAKAERRVRLTIGVLVAGSPAGDVTVETDTSGNAAVDYSQFAKLMESLVKASTLEDLNRRAAGRDFVPVSDLSSESLQIAFDLASLQLKVDLPVTTRKTGNISITDYNRVDKASLTAPADFSFGTTFSIAQRINHTDNLGDLDRDPLTVAARGFANVGGVDGVNLTFLTAYREGERPVRQRTTLFHDDVADAVRYAVGDLDPQTFGDFFSTTSLVGVGVERLYQTIQPYRNLRPSGRGGLVLDRPSNVEVLVNGTLYRTLSLGPGQYNLRDFPFLDGLNDVQLVVRDDTGRQETINLSFFSDTELLSRDISIFSATAGFRRNRFGDFRGTSYERSPMFTGFYQTGLSDRLTVGGGLQFDKNNALVTGQTVIGSPIGVFGLQAAADFNNRDSTQYSALLSYRLRSTRPGGRRTSLDFDLEYVSRDYSPLVEAPDQPNRYRWNIVGRYQTELWENAYGSFGASYRDGRAGFDNMVTAFASVTQRFGRVNVSVNYTYLQHAPRADHRATISLSVPLSTRQNIRTSYETDRNRTKVDYELVGFEGLNQTNARVSLARSDEGTSASADVEHFSNRFQAAAHHGYDRLNGVTREFTDLSAAFGIGYADGKFALGRNADRGFTIVDGHPTLNGAQITVSDSYALGPTARTGALGPALVPTQRQYQPNSLKIAVDDIPRGYDIGAGRIDILPGAASGYFYEVGSAASNTVIGHVTSPGGATVAYLAGQLVPLSGDNAQPVPFFTNSTGRMVAQKVAPGTYSVVLNGKDTPIGTITVPENPDGPVDIGELNIKE